MEKLENRAWNRELVRAAYASPRRPRWLGGTLAAWLGLGDAGAAHRHGLGCDFGYDFSQMTKMCIVTPIVGGSTEFGTRPAHGVGVPRGAGGRAAAFHTSLPGLESVVPIGACLGAQQRQSSNIDLYGGPQVPTSSPGCSLLVHLYRYSCSLKE